MASRSRFPRREILVVAASAGTVSLAGCGYFRSDDGLDLVIENEASSHHEARILVPASTDSFERTPSVAPGDQVTFEDAIEYPEHPEAVEYYLDLVGYPLHERGTFALSDDLERFGFRLVDSGEDSIDLLTLRDYRE